RVTVGAPLNFRSACAVGLVGLCHGSRVFQGIPSGTAYRVASRTLPEWAALQRAHRRLQGGGALYPSGSVGGASGGGEIAAASMRSCSSISRILRARAARRRR